MNVEMLERVAKRIEAIPNTPESVGLDMSNWGTKDKDCGTNACIAGHTLLEAGYQLIGYVLYERNGEEIGGIGVAAKAAELLGLSQNEAHSLFFISPWPWRFTSDTGKDCNDPINAAARIRYFIENGR